MHYVSTKSELIAACINPTFVLSKNEIKVTTATQQDNLTFITFQYQEPFTHKKNTLVYTGPASWNSLDQFFQQSPSLFSLKYNLKGPMKCKCMLTCVDL